MKNGIGFLDKRARNWEAVHYPLQERERLKALIQELGIKRGKTILDMGTGPGILIPYLRKKLGSSGRILSVYLSFEMLRQAKRKPLGALDLIVQADVHSLPFSGETIDRVICFAAFPHFRDKAVAIKEMSRVLKPGGELIIAHLLSREELARHHGAEPLVAHNLLPEDPCTRWMFEEAGLLLLNITNRPARYLAVGSKKERRL